jgi:hypothetical protein
LGHVLELLHIVRYQIHNLTARMPLTGWVRKANGLDK